MSRFRIRLRRSLIGHPRNQQVTARALGLTRINRSVVRPDTPAVRGMVRTIGHLVEVEEIEEEQATEPAEEEPEG